MLFIPFGSKAYSDSHSAQALAVELSAESNNYTSFPSNSSPVPREESFLTSSRFSSIIIPIPTPRLINIPLLVLPAIKIQLRIIIRAHLAIILAEILLWILLLHVILIIVRPFLILAVCVGVIGVGVGGGRVELVVEVGEAGTFGCGTGGRGGGSVFAGEGGGEGRPEFEGEVA